MLAEFEQPARRENAFGRQAVVGPVPFHTYLWKIASRCNLDCSYCYVYNRPDQRWRLQPKFMSEAVARQTAVRMREHLQAHRKKDASIIFHGGEPLLGGVEHLSMLFQVIEETFAGTNVILNVGMQSNGLLFTPELGDFMLSKGMSVGVSIDGPPAVNDAHRVDHQGAPSSARLEERLALLLSERYRPVSSGFLCVIDPSFDPHEVLDYLLSYRPSQIDFLFPLDNYDRRPKGKEQDLRSTPFGDWLIAAFDRWWALSSPIEVRIFNSILGILCGTSTLVESLGLTPVDLVVVETNGEVEGVDSLKATFEGATALNHDVFQHSFDLVAEHRAVRQRQMGLQGLCQTCQDCPVVEVCGGGYVPHRYSLLNGFDNPSVYCADLEKLIRHIHSTLVGSLAHESSLHHLAGPAQVSFAG